MAVEIRHLSGMPQQTTKKILYCSTEQASSYCPRKLALAFR
ncbi:hypothetical protein NPIL_552131, partial [Nephila pilipes]